MLIILQRKHIRQRGTKRPSNFTIRRLRRRPIDIKVLNRANHTGNVINVFVFQRDSPEKVPQLGRTLAALLGLPRRRKHHPRVVLFRGDNMLRDGDDYHRESSGRHRVREARRTGDENPMEVGHMGGDLRSVRSNRRPERAAADVILITF